MDDEEENRQTINRDDGDFARERTSLHRLDSQRSDRLQNLVRVGRYGNDAWVMRCECGVGVMR